MNSSPLKKTATENQYNLNKESDRQMLTRISKKFALLLVFIFMFDTLLDWFLGLMDLLIEVIHILIEAIEYSIELLLEHIFHTDHQQSEMIIVNGAIIISLFLLYKFCLSIPKLCNKLNKSCLLYVERKLSYWQMIPLKKQIKLVVAYSVGISIVLFFLTI